MWTVGSLNVTGLLIEARTPPGTAPASEDQAKGLLMGEVQRAVERLLGMIRGANVQPDQLASQLTGSFSELQASVKIDNITAERIGGSDGTYVERAEVKNQTLLRMTGPPSANVVSTIRSIAFPSVSPRSRCRAVRLSDCQSPGLNDNL